MDQLGIMHQRLSLDDGITIAEAHRCINEAIEAHRTTIQDLQSQINDLKRNSQLHEVCISSLKSQLNEFTSVSHLPPEVLCNIFSFAQRDDSGKILPYSEWTKFTHTSRHWRNVALNSAILWTVPDFHNFPWLREAIRRSKDAGLVFDLNFFGSDQEHLRRLQLALHCSSHIRGLYILDSPDLELWNKFFYELSRFAPRLEFLDVEGVDARLFPVTFGYSHRTGSPVVSQDVYRHTLRRLRSVRLVDCNINWDSCLLFQCAITRLTLQNISPRPTVKQFMLVMKEMPDLEILDLKNVFPLPDPPALSWTLQYTVHFARLRILRIYSDIREIETFFRLITFPPEAVVSVECFAEQFSLTHFAKTLVALGRSYSKRADPQFQTFTTYQPEYIDPLLSGIQLTLSMNVHLDKDLIYDDQENANLQMEFRWNTALTDPLVAKHIIDSIFSGLLPLQDLRQVCLDMGPEQNEIDPEMLVNTFGRLPEIRSFVAGKYSSRPFVDALELGLNMHDAVTMSAPPDSELENRTYFPKLSAIYLYDTRIVDSRSAPNPIAVPVELLQSCLVRRYRCGAEIQRVILRYCHALGQEEIVHAVEDTLFKAVEGMKISSQPPDKLEE